MNNIMLDLETFATGENAVIVSIGAVYFGPDVIGDQFYITIDPASCTQYGMEMNPKTIQWWLTQSEKARIEVATKGVPVEEALISFIDFYNLTGKTPNIWGNGVGFDNIILRNAYTKTGIPCPWSYKQDMDYRTLKIMNSDIEIERQGIEHNAVDDAKSQAEHLIKILNKVGWGEING